MRNNFTSEGQHKRSIVAMLIRLKNADKKESPNEWSYIKQVALTLGLKENSLDEIYSNLVDYDFSPPQTEKERMTILYYLLFFMRIDGEIADVEENLVQEFGFALGFRTSLTHELIQIIKNHADQQVPPEEMIQAIKKYLN